MAYIDVDGIKGIDSCKIFDEAATGHSVYNIPDEYKEPFPIKFENGLAISRVYVVAHSLYGSKYEYVTYTVIKEVKNEEGNVIDYELANKDHRYFKLPQYVEFITRSGNHFFFNIRTGNDEGTVTWHNFYHFEYNEDTRQFIEHGKLESEPTITKNPDLVILGNKALRPYGQLYSLSKQEKIGRRYSQIEDIDGFTFFVTDYISYTIDKNPARNTFLFDIDKEGNKISKVYSRNLGDFTEEEVEVPYEEIVKKEWARLKELLEKEEEVKKLLKNGQ